MHAHVTVHKRLLFLVMIVCLLTGCNTLSTTQNGRTTVQHVILPGMGCGKRSPLHAGNRLNDDELPITQWLADWAVRDDCASNPTVFLQQSRVTGEQWNSCRDNATIIHYRIYGGKHTWPRTGFAQDADGQVINATSLIWQFFWTHQLESPPI